MPAFLAAVVFASAVSLPAISSEPLIGAQPAEQRARELQLPAAHEAVDAEHFAGARLERDVAIGGAKRQGLGAKRDRRVGAAVRA